MTAKPFKTFEQQIEIMESRGLIIDVPDPVSFLSLVNYYRFSGYTHSYLLNRKTKDECFKPGTSFSNILNEYEFDRELSPLLFELLAHVELRLRTFTSYIIASRYGSLGHYNQYNFTNDHSHSKIMSQLEGEHTNPTTTKVFVTHHVEEKNSEFPIWVDVELMTFKNLAHLINCMTTRDLMDLDDSFTNVHITSLKVWAKALSHLRNEVAHCNRTYDQKYMSVPVHSKLSRQVDATSLFARILAAKELLKSDTSWLKFRNNFESLIQKHEGKIELSKIGLGSKWELALDLPFKPKKPNPR